MPFTERKILFIANEIREQCLELYSYLDCLYHEKEYVSPVIKNWSQVSKKPGICITFRGRDIAIAISEFHKQLVQSAHYSERFSAKVNEVMKQAISKGLPTILVDDWLRFFGFAYESIPVRSFEKYSKPKLFSVVQKEYFTLVPMIFDDVTPENKERLFSQILHSFDALIPLAQKIQEIAKNMDCVIDFKIQADLEQYLSQEDTLVIHYQKPEARRLIRECVEKTFRAYGVSIVDRKIKSDYGFDIFFSVREGLSHTNLIIVTLQYFFEHLTFIIFAQNHGWSFLQNEQNEADIAEFQVETILKTFEKKVEELYTLKPDTLLLEKEKYELLVRQEREKFKN